MSVSYRANEVLDPSATDQIHSPAINIRDRNRRRARIDKLGMVV